MIHAAQNQAVQNHAVLSHVQDHALLLAHHARQYASLAHHHANHALLLLAATRIEHNCYMAK